MLRVENLSKRYGDVRALEQVSFEIPQNSIVGVIGPNGAGKTTLLLGLAGLLPVDRGTVSWVDRVIPVYSRSHTVFYVEDAIQPQALLSLAYAVGFYGSVFWRTKTHCDYVIDRLRLRDFR